MSTLRALLFFPLFVVLANSPLASHWQAFGKALGSELDSPFDLPKAVPISQGIQVVRVADGQVLYALQAEEALSPASVSKLITSAALLHHFGPHHQFTTKIMYTGAILDGKISGQLILVGDGDPLFISETLWQLAADLKHLGLKEVQGGLVIDNSLFDGTIRDELRHAGAMASSHAYDAPVTAFGVNFNTLALAVAPGERVGAPAHAALDPLPIAGITLENRLKTSPPHKPISLEISRVSLPEGKAKIVLSGFIPLGHPLKKVYRSVNDPLLASGEAVRAFLQQQGVQIRGRLQQAPAPHGSKELLVVKSKALGFILQGLNHYSNNYIADVLVKRLGAESAESELAEQKKAQEIIGSYENGMRLIDHFLKQEVKITGPYQLHNGSGLTIQNRVSAAQITQLLVYMAKRWDLFPDFIASLPTAGKTGTLADRFHSSLASLLQGQLRAKTGTLTEPVAVSSLAGFTFHPRHGLLAFAIIQNGLPGQKQPAIVDLHASQERGLASLVQRL